MVVLEPYIKLSTWQCFDDDADKLNNLFALWCNALPLRLRNSRGRSFDSFGTGHKLQ